MYLGAKRRFINTLPFLFLFVQMARRVVSCILGLLIASATRHLATQVQKGCTALDHLQRSAARDSHDVTSCQSFMAAAALRACRTVWTMASYDDHLIARDNDRLRKKTSFTSLLLIGAVPVLNNSHL